jgi:DNA mismatch repair protein MutL
MPIIALDDNLINKIAAGEVVERPASVVKELIENAIDAGASIIKVNIANGGIDRMEVEDNGQGMDKEELPLAFQRHATSKIATAEDLFNITTMGFRGEALPSIASVSRIDLYSKKNDHEGVFIRLEGGQLVKQEYRPCPQGTRIIIKDLFFNTPARRNFLKSPVSEGGHIYELLCKYALARPDISFIFSNDKKTFFKTPGNNDLKDAVLCIYGRDFTRYLVEASHQGEQYAVAGMLSTPELRRLNRKHQFFFVNNRPVRSVLLFKAVDQAYSGHLLSREQPAVILSIDVPPGDIDVNVHPQKNEVRFKDEKIVFRMVYAVIKEALDKLDFRPIASFEPEKSQIPAGYQQPQHQSRELYEPAINFNYSPSPITSPHLLPAEGTGAQLQSSSIETSREFRVIGQCLNSYILLEMNQALYIVDQHAAHERIIYNKIKEAYASGKEFAQILAVPLPIELSTRQMEIIADNNGFFSELGFILDIIAPNTALLRGAPSSMGGQELDFIHELLEMWQDNSLSDLKDESIKTMACKRAVKAGDGLHLQEMEIIIEDLLNTENYKNCPHGRPTIIKMTHAELDRLFKR